MYVCAFLCGCATYMQGLTEARIGFWIPGARVTGGCEPPPMDAGNCAWVLCKGSKHS